MIASGQTNGEIADGLVISINSVRTYVRSAYRKIGATRRSQAVIWARHHGLGDAPFEGEVEPVPGLSPRDVLVENTTEVRDRLR